MDCFMVIKTNEQDIHDNNILLKMCLPVLSIKMITTDIERLSFVPKK